MRWLVVSDIDWLSSKTPAELRDVCNRYMIQSPKQILIKGDWSLLESDLYTICQ